jgi:hypothetical protein
MELARLAKLRAVFLGARRSAPRENKADPRAAAEAVLLQDDSTQTHTMKQAEAPRTAVQPAIRDGTVLSGRFQFDSMPIKQLSCQTCRFSPIQAHRRGGQSCRHRIARFIGRGGMGEVYEAEDLELGGRVALKTIRPGLLQDGHAVARFRREIQLSRQVTHTNICRVFDVGHDELDGRDLLFLTMEYLEGETLTSYLARNGSVPEAMALALGRQIAAGLDALHERGVVHRDLKPGNVMLRTSDSGAQRAVIMDFGLAREFETEAAETVVTRQGVVLGTPAYMAPEQRSGQSVTPASDVYSFGLVLYEMITGRKARPGLQKPGQTGLPERWEAVVLRCLEIDADARPKSASQALEGFDGPARKPPRWLAFGALALALGAAVPFLAPAWLERRAGSSVVGTGTGSVNDEILRARELLARYYEPQNIAEAIRVLEETARSHPRHAAGHAALAAAYWSQYNNTGKTEFVERARLSATQAIERDPDLAGPHVTLGAIYIETGP